MIAGIDLRRADDRGAIVWMLCMPVVFASFFGLVMAVAQPADVKVQLTVVDEDDGVLARVLVDELTSARLSGGDGPGQLVARQGDGPW